MNNLRVIATFILIGLIVVIAVFQMDIRGYEEVERINEWVLYYNSEDNNGDMLDYENYIIKTGFTEKPLQEGIDEGLFDDSELIEIENMILGFSNE